MFINYTCGLIKNNYLYFSQEYYDHKMVSFNIIQDLKKNAILRIFLLQYNEQVNHIKKIIIKQKELPKLFYASFDNQL